jgi:hypothetical protein
VAVLPAAWRPHGDGLLRSLSIGVVFTLLLYRTIAPSHW